MAIEGVMVSYNHSEDDANIITVAASGIKFSRRWVLTHGSILSPLKEADVISKSKGKPILNEEFYDHLPEMYVTCERQGDDMQKHYDGVTALSRQQNGDLEHSSYQVRVLTGRVCHVWQCPVLDRCVDDILYSWTIGHRDADSHQQTLLGKVLLSVFVLIDLEGEEAGSRIVRPLSELYDAVRPPPGRGAPLALHSTPFGCEAFLNTVTRGAVCGAVGARPSLLLTDAAAALGSEGGPVFAVGGDAPALVATVVCSVSWWRGEWVGLALLAPLDAVLRAKLRPPPPAPPPPPPAAHAAALQCIDSSIVLVRCGAAWGAGVYLGRGYVATCAHVVKHHESQRVSVYCGGVKETAIVRYKTADDTAYDLALIYSNPENWRHLTTARFAEEPAKKGDTVLAAGFPFFNENDLRDLRPTVTSGHVTAASPAMLLTSCCVQSGFSGGAIYRLRESAASLQPEVVGVIVCNARSQTGACYPYINMAVPAHVFVRLFYDFMVNKDMTPLRSLQVKEDIVQSQWRLLPYRSKI